VEGVRQRHGAQAQTAVLRQFNVQEGISSARIVTGGSHAYASALFQGPCLHRSQCGARLRSVNMKREGTGRSTIMLAASAKIW